MGLASSHNRDAYMRFRSSGGRLMMRFGVDLFGHHFLFGCDLAQDC